MAENAAVPFYNKALGSAVLEGMAATPAQLASMRAGLGVTDGCAEGMHAEVYSQLAGQLLAAGSLSAADQERLTSTRDLLGMADDVAGLEMNLADPFDPFQNAERMGEPRRLPARQIGLRWIARHRIFGAFAKARQHHFHLRHGRVLRFVNDDKSVRQGASAHKCERRNFNITRCAATIDLIPAQHHMQRVPDWLHIRVNFFV